MVWLNILDNGSLQLIAEIGVIVLGSILMGILLAYFYWGGYKKKTELLNNKLDLQRDLVTDLRNQLEQVTSVRDHLISELSEERNKLNTQAKSIYDLGRQLYGYESQLRENKSIIEELNDTIRQYEARLHVIEAELLRSREMQSSPKKIITSTATRANYDHVSQLLDRQVTENDLTLISGIGPRTASLLQKLGIDTWEALAGTSVDALRQILSEAGGVYKTQDPTHWPKQASMASQSEWRKLRVYQETLKKIAE